LRLNANGTEVRVRRPQAGKPGRRAFVSVRLRQNIRKTAVVTDEKGRTLRFLGQALLLLSLAFVGLGLRVRRESRMRRLERASRGQGGRPVTSPSR
jgi:hypothetical protein